MKDRKIYCTGCRDLVYARLTDGLEVYPHRGDLKNLPFWKCDACKNFVGCHHKHHKEFMKTEPLGCIPTPELKKVRRTVHSALDPLWKYGRYSRKAVYKIISNRIGREFHTATLTSVQEGLEVLRIIEEL